MKTFFLKIVYFIDLFLTWIFNFVMGIFLWAIISLITLTVVFFYGRTGLLNYFKKLGSDE